MTVSYVHFIFLFYFFLHYINLIDKFKREIILPFNHNLLKLIVTSLVTQCQVEQINQTGCATTSLLHTEEKHA